MTRPGFAVPAAALRSRTVQSPIPGGAAATTWVAAPAIAAPRLPSAHPVQLDDRAQPVTGPDDLEVPELPGCGRDRDAVDGLVGGPGDRRGGRTGPGDVLGRNRELVGRSRVEAGDGLPRHGGHRRLGGERVALT